MDRSPIVLPRGSRRGLRRLGLALPRHLSLALPRPLGLALPRHLSLALPRHLGLALPRHLGLALPRPLGLALTGLFLAAASAPGSTTAALSSRAGGASAQAGVRPDQVHVHEAKSGKRSVLTGTVVENSLTKVRVEREGKESRADALDVERIAWGDVSPTFREAQVFFERGDFENSAAKYRQATEAEARAVVKAAARQRAGEALMELGSKDPSKYADALAEFERFLADHRDDRAVPEVRRMQARAILLSGDPKAAGVLYRAIFEEGTGATPTPGYDPLMCAQAGLAAAEALLAAGDTLAAREIFGVLKTTVASMRSQLPPGSSRSEELAAIAAEADLGEGYVLIANGQTPQAESFFEARLRNADSAGSTTRFGAMMGLAEAHAAKLEYAKARVLFAGVAAIDFTNRDRAARALLRLAQTTLELKEPDARQRALQWLNDVIESYGDTPSARVAREILSLL